MPRPHLVYTERGLEGAVYLPLVGLTLDPLPWPEGLAKPRRIPALDWQPASPNEAGWLFHLDRWWVTYPVAARLLRMDGRNLSALVKRWGFRVAEFPIEPPEPKPSRIAPLLRPRRIKHARLWMRTLLVADLEQYSIQRTAWKRMHGDLRKKTSDT